MWLPFCVFTRCVLAIVTWCWVAIVTYFSSIIYLFIFTLLNHSTLLLIYPSTQTALVYTLTLTATPITTSSTTHSLTTSFATYYPSTNCSVSLTIHIIATLFCTILVVCCVSTSIIRIACCGSLFITRIRLFYTASSCSVSTLWHSTKPLLSSTTSMV